MRLAAWSTSTSQPCNVNDDPWVEAYVGVTGNVVLDLFTDSPPPPPLGNAGWTHDDHRPRTPRAIGRTRRSQAGRMGASGRIRRGAFGLFPGALGWQATARTGLEDLPRTAVQSDKAGLRAVAGRASPFGDYLAARAAHRCPRLHRTSGTTGQAMNLALSARDCAITEIVGARAQALAGLGPGMMVVHCLNYQMWMGGLTDHMTLETHGRDGGCPFGVGASELLVRTILETGIDAISCTPSYPSVLRTGGGRKIPGLGLPISG